MTYALSVYISAKPINNRWHFSALCQANVGIVLSSTSGNATLHSTVLLVCVAGGNSTPEVTWHFSGSPIQSDASTKVLTIHSST